MKKGKLTKGLACLLALTLLFTSVFFIAIKYDVFGAVKENPVTDNNYVDETSVASSSISLIRNDSNVKRSLSNGNYDEWDPNAILGTDAGLPKVPQQSGEKGSSTNPFVLLEIVPDRSMMELPYFVGNEESGLPFSQGALSATIMNQLRTRYSKENKIFKTLRFTDERYDSTRNNSEDPSGFIDDKIEKKVRDMFGFWTVDYSYDIFKLGSTNTKDDTTKLYDCRKKNNGQGSFKFNEIYNFDITDDDLLDTYPSSWDAPTIKKAGEDYKYNEVRCEIHTAPFSNAEYNSNTYVASGYSIKANEKTAGSMNKPRKVNGKSYANEYHKAEYSPMYYTDDLICLAKRDNLNNVPTEQEVTGFIKKYLYKIKFDSIEVMASNKNGNNKTDGVGCTSTKISKDVKKYNLENFVQAEWAAKNSFKTKYLLKGMSDAEAEEKAITKAHQVAQDVTAGDMVDSGQFDQYEASTGVMQRGSNGYTYHEDLKKTNFWKMQFRKYYYDRFNELYDTFRIKQKAYDEEIKKLTQYAGLGNLQNGLSDDAEKALNERNAALRTLMVEYEPLFTRNGVDVKTFEDAYDWEVQERDTVSLNRSYISQNQGGYMLAVRPGQGELILLNKDEIRALMAKMTAKEIENSGIKEDSFIFVREDQYYELKNNNKIERGSINRYSDSLKNDIANRKRWVYVSWRWGLEGDCRASQAQVYRSGILDDSKYSVGFASKSVIDGSHYWMAIYDRKNRRYHSGSGYDEISYKMYEKTNQVSDNANYTRLHPNGENPYFRFNNKNYSDTAKNDYYYQWSREGGTNYPVDDFHLNIKDTISNQWGAYTLGAVSGNDYLILDSDYGWRACDGSSQPFFLQSNLYDYGSSEMLTGMCMNFNTGDVYNKNTARNGSEKNRFKDPEGTKLSKSDVVAAVSNDQLVCETGKKYHFTYYGFNTTDILQRTLFSFTPYTDNNGREVSAEDEYKNFHMKVVVATPAELNQISKISGNKLDLIERADMYYIHTTKTKTYNEEKQDQVAKIYDFYNALVKKDGEADKSYSNVTLFDDNDLEWNLCQKIIERSAGQYGASLPILFNQLVGEMSESSETGDGKQDDTHMYICSRDSVDGYNDNNGKPTPGNESNIAKIYQVLLQFDLRAGKGDYVWVDGKKTKIQRTFMADIYPFLQKVKIADSRRASTKVENTAEYTGFVPGYNIATDPDSKDTDYDYADRKLCTKHNDDLSFKEHTYYLWNKFTFYPWEVSEPITKRATDDNTKAQVRRNLVAQGYSYNYFHPEDLFNITGKWYYVVGRTGNGTTNEEGYVIDPGNVYVLNHPGDPSNGHGRNLLIDYGQGPNKINDFFMVAFRILDAQPLGKVSIKAMPRKNVYTKLSDKLVWMDYLRKDTVRKDDAYTADDLKTTLDVKVQATNSNNMDACITEVYLRKSSDAQEKELRPLGTNGQFITGGFATLLSSARSDLNDTGGTPIKKEKVNKVTGFKVPNTFGGGRLNFFVPYTLDDFFEGYDEIVFKIRAYQKKTDDTGKETIKSETQDAVISITESELFNLE